jgi:membrane protein DedA with SNARE-associated domain
MRTNWVGCLIGGVVCLLIAFLLAPLFPYPISSIVAIICWIAAAVLLILCVVHLVRGGV